MKTTSLFSVSQKSTLFLFLQYTQFYNNQYLINSAINLEPRTHFFFLLQLVDAYAISHTQLPSNSQCFYQLLLGCQSRQLLSRSILLPHGYIVISPHLTRVLLFPMIVCLNNHVHIRTIYL